MSEYPCDSICQGCKNGGYVRHQRKDGSIVGSYYCFHFKFDINFFIERCNSYEAVENDVARSVREE